MQYHVLYWEQADNRGIQFADPDDSTGPGICPHCTAFCGAHRQRLDNLQCSVRVCLQPDGRRFRADVGSFTCLSPRRAVKIQLDTFQASLERDVPLCLSESVVLSAVTEASRHSGRSAADRPQNGIQVTAFPAQEAHLWLQSDSVEFEAFCWCVRYLRR